jgi:transposase
MVLKIAKGKEKPDKLNVRNTPSGRAKMLDEFARRGEAANGAEITFAYEASSLGFGLYDEITEAGYRCHVFAPTKIPGTVKQKKNKTDEKDAEKILDVLRAHVLAGADLPDVWVPDEETRDDRELVRGRIDVGEKVTRIKSQIRSLLKRTGKRKPKRVGESWSRVFRGWLKYLVGSEKELGRGARFSLGSLIEQLEFFEDQKEWLDGAIEELSRKERYAEQAEELMKLKGVGIMTTMTFLTEIGLMSRFSNRRKLGAYLGLVPSSRESGESSDRKGHITRQGPYRIRKVLCQAAWSSMRWDKAGKAFYERIVEKNPKHKKIAVVALMRHLAVRMWHIALDVEEGVSNEPRRAPSSKRLRRAM